MNLEAYKQKIRTFGNVSITYGFIERSVPISRLREQAACCIPRVHPARLKYEYELEHRVFARGAHVCVTRSIKHEPMKLTAKAISPIRKILPSVANARANANES